MKQLKPGDRVAVARVMDVMRQLCPERDDDTTVRALADQLRWPLDSTCQTAQWMFERRLLDAEVGLGYDDQPMTVQPSSRFSTMTAQWLDLPRSAAIIHGSMHPTVSTASTILMVALIGRAFLSVTIWFMFSPSM